MQRIGKYKSAGDQLTRKSISEPNREMLTALLDNINGHWLDNVSLMKGKFGTRTHWVFCFFFVLNLMNVIRFAGKKREEIENFISEGVYQIDRLKEDGWITDIKYDDEV